MAEYDGLLPLYKPRGMTSHDCVARIRKTLAFRKIGHTGTLDPDADGVLVLCLGRATKIAQYLLDGQKTYKGIIRLGTATDTEDESGSVVASASVCGPIAREKIECAFHRHTGPIRQSPPMYSAVKVNGRKLYEYARAGLSVERPARSVHIYDLKIDGDARTFDHEIPFSVTCSKGTYIRTLAVDIGRSLGYPAHLGALTRIKAGPFRIEECLTFEQIEEKRSSGRLAECLLPLEAGLAHLGRWTVDRATAARVMHGAVLPAPEGLGNRSYAVYDPDGRCLAIYRPHKEKKGLAKPEKVLVAAK